MEPEHLCYIGNWTEYRGTLESYQINKDQVQLNFKEKQLMVPLEDFELSGLASDLKDMGVPCRMAILRTDYDVKGWFRWRFM